MMSSDEIGEGRTMLWMLPARTGLQEHIQDVLLPLPSM